MTNESWIDATMQRVRREGLERHAGSRHGRGALLDFSSNDYLGLARSQRVVESALAALRQWGAGAGASRLVGGTLPCHEELESRLASLKGYPAALLFGSGYMANAGVIPALAGRADYVVADRLAHASIIDAAVLSRARLLRFRHNDVDHLSWIMKGVPHKARCLVVTESVFSMDGDPAPLVDIADFAGRRGAMLMVDEAHATGVFGPKGSGLVREARVEGSVNVCMGTLSKALGGYGGFVACSEAMRRLLVNRSRSFIYSTAVPPVVAGAALGAIKEMEAHPEWGLELLSRAGFFRKRLKDAGLDTGRSASQIIPVFTGKNSAAVALSRRLGKNGILATAIRPPTVPEGTARLRLSVTLSHSPEDLRRAADIIIENAREEGIP